MGDIYIKRIEPRNFGFDELLGFGEVSALTFESSPLASYTSALSPVKWRYETHRTLLEDGELSSKERLDMLVKRASDMRDLSYMVARMARLNLTDSGAEMFIAVEKTNGEERVIGATLWKYPQHMSEELDKRLGRTGLAWRLYSVISRVWCYAEDMLARRGATHPYVNGRLTRFATRMYADFSEDACTEEALSQMSPEELRTAIYPIHLMPSCELFCILPSYQRRGIGQLLMKASIEQIPATPTPVKDNQGSLRTIPPKLQVEASEEGVGMYKKAGFTTHKAVVYEDAGFQVPVTHMIYHTRI